MARLDQDKQRKLEPKRMQYAKDALKHLGLEILFECENTLRFNFNGNLITLYPYSGWFSGKGIKDGRGISNLIQQLKK